VIALNIPFDFYSTIINLSLTYDMVHRISSK